MWTRLRMLLALTLSLSTANVELRAEDRPQAEQEPAPEQHPQPLYFTAHPSLFTVPDASQAFERDLYPPQKFLPEEVYRQPDAEADLYAEGKVPTIELAQYPTIDSAARDVTPDGQEPGSWWNPVPYISQQLASLPQDERGLIMQEFSITDTVLTPASDSYSMNTLDMRTTLYFGRLPILRLTPRFGWHVIGDSGQAGMPPQFFDAGLDTTLFLPLGERWSFLGMVGPSIFSDGKNTTSQAFRITGRALAFYQWSETVKLSGGFLYLDRVDVTALPAGGIFYQPHDGMKVEAFFPRPRVAWRLRQAEQVSTWGYVAGEFGGNSWAIERSNGTPDVMTLRDYRLIAGIEHLNGEDFRCLMEAGFVFGRKVEYTSGLGNTTQSPTAMLRGGVVF